MNPSLHIYVVQQLWTDVLVRRGGRKQGSRSRLRQWLHGNSKTDTSRIFCNYQEALTRKSHFRRPVFIYTCIYIYLYIWWWFIFYMFFIFLSPWIDVNNWCLSLLKINQKTNYWCVCENCHYTSFVLALLGFTRLYVAVVCRLEVVKTK